MLANTLSFAKKFNVKHSTLNKIVDKSINQNNDPSTMNLKNNAHIATLYAIRIHRSINNNNLRAAVKKWQATLKIDHTVIYLTSYCLAQRTKRYMHHVAPSPKNEQLQLIYSIHLLVIKIQLTPKWYHEIAGRGVEYASVYTRAPIQIQV